ncbi:MAG: CehA/McbA family metallohydrolase [Victivallales bacterium]|nr:CehA/McbA family metallohydrolase [Victivallales bacterium]
MSSPLCSFALIGDPQYADRDTIPGSGREYRNGLRLHRETISLINQTPDLDFLVSLGDLGDGISREEFPPMLASLADSRIPVRHVVGNHDYVLHSEEELLELFGLESMFYDFAVGGVRFLVLNGLDVSRFSPPGSARLAESRAFRASHPWLQLREWDGMLSTTSKAWLRQKLEASLEAGELAIILCHVPVLQDASGPNVRMWDHAEIFEILDAFPHVRGWFSGHYHPGGIALRNGVLHKTVKAICNCTQATATIARVYRDHIDLEAIGEEAPFHFPFDLRPVTISGTAPPGTILVADTGELTQATDDGSFLLKVPAPGIYCLKAMAEGCQDAFVPRLRAPCNNVRIVLQASPGRKLFYYPNPPRHFQTLRILDDGVPVRSFDLAGVPFGGITPATPCWNEHCDHFWTRGPYAFTAAGNVTCEQVLCRNEALRSQGWYKGDFHAHIIHGENTYCGNLPLFAFAAQAEGYDWLIASSNFANDQDVTDYKRLADILSTPDFLLRLNAEFPKTWRGHVGNLGVEPITIRTDTELVTNLELVQRYIAPKGGVSIPVHPLYNDVIRQDEGGTFSWMTSKELFLWLLCAPELCPCLDLLYNKNTPNTLDFYNSLLNRGYRIGVTATSDAAFDVGRTPGFRRGATYVKMDRLDMPSLLDGLRERRTIVTWDGAAVLLEIDGATSGTILRPNRRHHLKVTAWNLRNLPDLEVRVVRNGTTVLSTVMEHEKTLEWDFSEQDCCWYRADLMQRGDVLSMASPIYFRDERFQPPEVLPIPQTFSREFLDYMKYLDISEITASDAFERFRARLLQEL